MSLDSSTSAESGLQQLLELAEKDCRHDRSHRAFRDAVLRQVHSRLAARSMRLWDVRDATDPVCLVLAGPGDPVPNAEDLRAAAAGVVDVAVVDAGDAEPRCHRMLTASPVVDDVRLVLEVVVSVPPAERELLVAVSDVLADIHRRMLLGKLVARERQVFHSGDLISLLHADLDVDRIANTLASDVASVLGCDRVSVCRRVSGNRWTVIAATAVGRPDARSDAVRAICDAVREAESQRVDRAAASGGSPAGAGSGDGGGTDVPLTGGTTAIVYLLKTTRNRGDDPWAVVMETGRAEALDPELADWVCRHAAAALRNSERLEQSSLVSRLRRIPGRLASRRPLAISLIVLAGLSVFLASPTELTIEASGRVLPSERVRIFTPDDGIITAVTVTDGSPVTSGEPLCRLRNDDVELQLETVTGDLAAARARLAALEASRGTPNSDRGALRSGEEAELLAKVESLERQREILDERRRALVVESPLSGRVYGNVLSEYLRGRPVQRGQYLFDVADPESPWQLELEVSEADIRHVLAARRQSGEEPRVTYSIETSPSVRRETRLRDLSDAVEVNAAGELTTRATAGPGEAALTGERPGAGVLARIHCGRRSRVFVYFRSVIEFVQRQLLF